MSAAYPSFLKALPRILDQIPASWKGTTYNNSHLLGRSGFSEKLLHLVETKGDQLTEQDLLDVGNAEDYFRVSSNVSSTLEIALALSKGYSVDQVFTWSSRAMPLVAVAHVVPGKVHVYRGAEEAPFSQEQLRTLEDIGCQLEVHEGFAPAAKGEHVVVALGDVPFEPASVDVVVHESVLYICDPARVDQAQILVRRKRMSAPATTPVSLAALRKLAGQQANAIEEASAEDVAALYAHLQTLSGTSVNVDVNPVLFTSGLPSIASLWMSLIARGGADAVMASTAYGGSSQLTDLITGSSKLFNKHTFDLQGLRGMEQSIKERLDAMRQAGGLLPTTVLFIETPTNPDMKVPNLKTLATLLTEYAEATGKNVLLLVDGTFAPNSRVIRQMHELAPSINTCVFLSLSKSVSRGKTCAGCLVFNDTPEAKELRDHVAATTRMLDTGAKIDQVKRLVANHVGVEERCAVAYKMAVSAGDSLVAAVEKCTGQKMRLAFVSPETAAQGFTTSTFSFNLPPVEGASQEENEALAQNLVDLIAKHNKFFKPCVSFGQDNGLVYATVPATSTQGAIKQEDKAKQAVGGVQLTRLSFPPTIDIDAVNKIIRDSIFSLYGKSE